MLCTDILKSNYVYINYNLNSQTKDTTENDYLRQVPFHRTFCSVLNKVTLQKFQVRTVSFTNLLP